MREYVSQFKIRFSAYILPNNAGKLYAFAEHSINKSNSENKLTNPDHPSMKCPENNMTDRIRCEFLIGGLATEGASGFYNFFLNSAYCQSVPYPVFYLRNDSGST